MKLDLNKHIMNLDGEPMEQEIRDDKGNVIRKETPTLGKVLAGQIAGSQTEDPIKFFDWAISLNRGEAIEIDASDLDKLETFVKTKTQLSTLAIAQVLKEIKKARG